MPQPNLPLHRRSAYDVTDVVCTTDPEAVGRSVAALFMDLYGPTRSGRMLERVFADCAALFRGQHPSFHRCDTEYHDLQHTLDVALAMARLMDGHERSARRSFPLGDRLFVLGVATALFHDIGYLRRIKDSKHRFGAEYTKQHVGRGARFLQKYLGQIGLPDLARVGADLLHFTGYERPVEQIRLPGAEFRLLGNMLGTADIIAQMSDRCYLEKCRDRLYPEFELGGIAGAQSPLFRSPEQLLAKTPDFYRGALHRLRDTLSGVYTCAEGHFGGQNLYIEAIEQNMRYAARMSADAGADWLRRQPPPSLAAPSAEDEGPLA